jgi:hypothetical protein
VKMVFLPSQCMNTILTTPITKNALCPNQKLLHKGTTSHPGVKKILCISCAGHQQLDSPNINEKYNDYKW